MNITEKKEFIKGLIADFGVEYVRAMFKQSNEDFAGEMDATREKIFG